MIKTNDQITFLLVDPDLDNLDSYVLLLQEMGYHNTLQAEDGAEAWAMIKNFNVDFIISELHVPEFNALVLLKVLRNQESSSSTPFILIATNVTAKLVCQAGRAGVSSIIVRPWTPEVFKKKITEVTDLDNDPKIVEAERAYEKGLSLMKAGRLDEALKSFEQVVTIQGNAEVYFNMGYIKSAKGQYDEALQCFRVATRIDNDHARAYKKMGEIYTKLGQVGDASKYLAQAADIYMERKQDTEAEELFEAVVKLQPDTTNVYNSLGIILRRQGRLLDSAYQYQKALKVHPHDENIYFNLGRVYLGLKENDLAREALKKALEINPHFSEAKDSLRALEMGVNL